VSPATQSTNPPLMLHSMFRRLVLILPTWRFGVESRKREVAHTTTSGRPLSGVITGSCTKNPHKSKKHIGSISWGIETVRDRFSTVCWSNPLRGFPTKNLETSKSEVDWSKQCSKNVKKRQLFCHSWSHIGCEKVLKNMKNNS